MAQGLELGRRLHGGGVGRDQRGYVKPRGIRWRHFSASLACLSGAASSLRGPWSAWSDEASRYGRHSALTSLASSNAATGYLKSCALSVALAQRKPRASCRKAAWSAGDWMSAKA